MANAERTNHQHIVSMAHEELQGIYQMALERNQTKQAKGVRSKRWDGVKDDFTIHYEGLRAEWAVCAWFGIEFVHWLSLYGDKGRPDLVVHRRDARGSGGTIPTTVEVKYRDRRHYEFALPGDDLSYFRADIGVLVLPTGNPKSVWLAGWVGREEFSRHHRIENFGYGKRATIAQHLMRDMLEL